MISKLKLPQRSGYKPHTTDSIPHSQLNQHGPNEIIEKLHDFCFSLADVLNENSQISVPGARALVMHESVKCNHDAFMVGREFAHIHPHPDNGSMHLILDKDDALEVTNKYWGEDHYLVTQGKFPHGLVMVFSPRDDAELEVVKEIVMKSYEYAIAKA